MDGVKTHFLTMYNDDVNSFDHIMGCLIRFCDHDPVQAEQCAIIAHHKGKCQIVSGSFDDMIFVQRDLEKRDIVTELHKYESHMH